MAWIGSGASLAQIECHLAGVASGPAGVAPRLGSGDVAEKIAWYLLAVKHEPPHLLLTLVLGHCIKMYAHFH